MSRITLALLAWVLGCAPLFAGDAGKEAPKPGPEEYVYEGRTAVEWAKDLRAGQNVEKAAHALLKLGKDAVPPLVQMVRERDPKLSTTASNILTAMKHDRDAVPIFTALLKDTDFEVRRTAVHVLGEFAPRDAVARQALTEAMRDRDKAVVEAAEKALEPLEEQQPRVELLLTQATASLDQSLWDRAAALAADALRLDPDNERANKIIELAHARLAQRDRDDEVVRLKREPAEKAKAEELRKKAEIIVREALTTLQRGETDRAVKLAMDAVTLDPNNEQARRIIEVARKDMVERKRETEDKAKRRQAEAEPKDF